MTRLPRAERARELMDEPGAPAEELGRALDDIAAVNRWLGGRRALLRHLQELLPRDGRATILDAGTGSGDLPRAILDWAERHGRDVHIIAADLHGRTLEIARERAGDLERLVFEQADATRLPHPDGAVDIALLSMTLHHLEREDQITALFELARVARRGVLVGELERSWPAYLGARALAATVWRTSPITRHDGPLSIRRAFTPAELLELAAEAGLHDVTVHRHPFFRLVLRSSGGHPGPQPATAGP